MPEIIPKMRKQLTEYAVREAETVEDFLSAGEYSNIFRRSNQKDSHSEITIEFDQFGVANRTQLKVLMHPFKRQKNGASPLHRHSYFEMGFVFSGECISISDGEETHLKTGDLFIVSLQALHQMKTFSPEDYVFNIMISESLFDKQFFKMIEGYNLFSSFFINSILNIQSDACLIFHSNEQIDFTYYIYKLLCEYLFKETRDLNYIRLLLACVFRELSRQYQNDMEKKSQQENKGLSISDVLQYLTKNYATATLQSTSDYFHYTTRFMTGFISKYTGSSFARILRELKLQNAKHLVLHTNLSFEEIAQSVGYNERGYLDRIFKKKHGQTMSEFRKK